MVTTCSRDDTTRRESALRDMLEARRREVLGALQGQLRQARRDSTSREVLDEGKQSDADTHDDIAAALLQLTSETLTLINGALRRLQDGTYGVCVECGDTIAEARLRALPFAVRCRDCEEVHELRGQHRRGAVRKGAGALFCEASHLG